MRRRVTIAGCLIVVAFTTAAADARLIARRASHADQLLVAKAVAHAFGAPTTHARLTIVLYPICSSSVDARFAFVVANPVQQSGAVAQPGYFYLRRIGNTFRLLDPLLTAGTALRRPNAVPVAVYRDFNVGGKPGLCSFQGAAEVTRVLRRRTAPIFHR
jgi:hypothetical protein